MTARSPRFSRLGDGSIAYQTDWIAVREYPVERDGVGGMYSVVERPDAVVVIPLTPAHRTVLLKQFRFPTNDSSWELPMGALTGTEPAEAAGRRELTEETGLRGQALIRIGDYRAAPGLTPQQVTVFVASVADHDLDAAAASWSASDEIQEVSIVQLADLAGMISEGRVTDGYTLAGFLLVRLWLERQEQTR